MKLKIMPMDKYEGVFNLNWVPVELVKGDMPDLLKGLPEDLLHRIMISGSFINTESYQSKLIPSGSLIGGMDVYRNAPDDPVELNKDWYALVRNPNDESTILVDGPFKDAEHWLNEIPKRLQNIEIFAVSKTQDKTRLLLDGKAFQLGIHDAPKNMGYRLPQTMNGDERLYLQYDDNYILRSHSITVYENGRAHKIWPVLDSTRSEIVIQAKDKKELRKRLQERLDSPEYTTDQKEHTLGPTLKALQNKNRGKISAFNLEEAKGWAPCLYYWLKMELEKDRPYEGIREKYNETKEKLKKDRRVGARPKHLIVLAMTLNLIKREYPIESSLESFKRHYLTGFGGVEDMKDDVSHVWSGLANVFFHRKPVLSFLYLNDESKPLVVKNPKVVSEKPLKCEFLIYQNNGKFKKEKLTYTPSFSSETVDGIDHFGKRIRRKDITETPIWTKT